MSGKFDAEAYDRKEKYALREMCRRLDDVDIRDVPGNLSHHTLRKDVLLDYFNHECSAVSAYAHKLLWASPCFDSDTPDRWNAVREEIADFVSGRMQN